VILENDVYYQILIEAEIAFARLAFFIVCSRSSTALSENHDAKDRIAAVGFYFLKYGN